MKPTEADIQAELIEGWEIVQKGPFGAFKWFDISDYKSRVVFFSDSYGHLYYGYAGQEKQKINHADFLTGNYDLSAISQHYEPEEWQRIITMCERIVRLITGEQVEQSLEEKVREILEPTNAAFVSIVEGKVFIRDSDYKYWISGNTIEYMPLLKGSDHKLIRQSINEYFCDERGEFWSSVIRSIAALLTAQPESEQTLEEAVKALVRPAAHLVFDHIRGNEVLVTDEHDSYWISDEFVTIGPNKWKVGSYRDAGRKHWKVFLQIAALLSTRSTKPSYSELEQRVEELEKESKRLAGDYDEVYEECEEAKKRHREARKLMERYQEDALKAKQKCDNLLTDYQRECEALENMRERLERSEAENASLLDKFGPIDQAEQQVAEVETRFQKLAKKCERIADLLIQLNEEIL